MSYRRFLSRARRFIPLTLLLLIIWTQAAAAQGLTSKLCELNYEVNSDGTVLARVSYGFSNSGAEPLQEVEFRLFLSPGQRVEEVELVQSSAPGQLSGGTGDGSTVIRFVLAEPLPPGSETQVTWRYRLAGALQSKKGAWEAEIAQPVFPAPTTQGVALKATLPAGNHVHSYFPKTARVEAGQKPVITWGLKSVPAHIRVTFSGERLSNLRFDMVMKIAFFGLLAGVVVLVLRELKKFSSIRKGR